MATAHARTPARGHLRWGRVAVSALLVLALAAVVLAGHGWADRVRAFLAPADSSVAQAEHWTVANLPGDARILADSSVRADLVRAGVPAWEVTEGTALEATALTPATGWRSYDYILSTPLLRSLAPAGGQLRLSLASSAVVASFGVGAARVEVRELAPQGFSAVAQRTQRLQQASAEAGRELLTSPRVRLSPEAEQQAVSGQVDGRLLSILVGLGSQFTLTVAGFSDPDPGGLYENRLRQVSVIVVDGTLVADTTSEVAAVTGWLAAQHGSFRPAAVAVRGHQLLIRFRVIGPREPDPL